MATDALPYSSEFPGTRHYAVAFLSYRLPTIMDVPPSGCLSKAVYNACGVRIREHPITKEKILAGLKAKAERG